MNNANQLERLDVTPTKPENVLQSFWDRVMQGYKFVMSHSIPQMNTLVTRTKTKELEAVLQRIYDSYILGENNAGTLAYVAKDELARIKKDYPNESTLLANIGQDANKPAGEPLTDTYVQVVPDKCDRITWQGNYYDLKLLLNMLVKNIPGDVIEYIKKLETSLVDHENVTHGPKADWGGGWGLMPYVWIKGTKPEVLRLAMADKCSESTKNVT